ncbi:hypothetical protein HDU92_002803 [Lobulomyces angularis]|nr:hypothetical protein HDU92_002803 [Lobulomyces angularis]
MKLNIQHTIFFLAFLQVARTTYTKSSSSDLDLLKRDSLPPHQVSADSSTLEILTNQVKEVEELTKRATFTLISNNILVFLSSSAAKYSAEWYCSTTVGDMLKSGGWNVIYAGFGQIASAIEKNKIVMYVQPGGNGDVNDLYKKFTSSDVNAIKKFVWNGGRICMGGFLATDLGLNMVGTSYYNEIKGYQNAMLVPATWKNNEIRNIFVESAPQINSFNEVKGETKIYSRFTQNNYVNMFIKKFGNGYVGISAAHFEAVGDWVSKSQRNGFKKSWDIGLEFVNAILMRKV